MEYSLLNGASRGTPYKVFSLVIALLTVWCISYYGLSDKLSFIVPWKKAPYSHLDVFLTAKGKVPIDQIERNVFVPYGYSIVSATKSVVPVLKRKNPETCDRIFQNWLESSKNPNNYMLQKDTTPHADFTMNGHAEILNCFYNDSANNDESYIASRNFLWTEEAVRQQIEHGISSGNFTLHYPDARSVYYTTKTYNIKDKVGAVIGSLSPWVEIICLINGAKHIFTFDYQKVRSGHSQISFVHAYDFAKDHYVYYNAMDFVITYSSLEHSGLGRYGDPLDPFGDIKEMRKIRCMLKPGGLLFLGLPMGPEVLGNNCHRIYGRIRLALMIEGFELLSFYYGNNSQPVEDDLKIFSEPKPIHEVYHYVAVLRKI